MTRDFRSELHKDMEYLKHLFFGCLVDKLLLEVVFEDSNISIANFEPIAFNWLCNKCFDYMKHIWSLVFEHDEAQT
jgi:hypothetical protein